MSELVIEGKAGTLVARLTPWDQRALGFPTAEVTSLEASDGAAVEQLIAEASHWARGQGVTYLFGRVDGNDLAVRGALLASGFHFVETSLTVSRSGMGGLPTVPRGMLPSLRPAVLDDIQALRQIAFDDFGHGRFLEDPAIDPAKARERTANWIEDMVHAGLAYAAESRGRIIGFHAERTHPDEHRAELLLTGAAAPYAVLAVPLWITALESLAARNIHHCTTLVSAANTGIINLYSRLGFQFNRTLTGFRKFL